MEIETLIDTNELAEDLAVVKFFAPWCGPCRLYAPAFERVASKNPDARFYEVDIDQNPELRVFFGVTSVPTTLVIKDGEVLANQSGALSTRSLTNLLDSVHADST